MKEFNEEKNILGWTRAEWVEAEVKLTMSDLYQNSELIESLLTDHYRDEVNAMDDNEFKEMLIETESADWSAEDDDEDEE